MIKAEHLGCRCSECPLRDADGPVLPQRSPDYSFVVIGEYPSIKATGDGLPFTGPGGEMLRAAFREAGVSPSKVTMHYAVMCRAPEGRLDAVLARLRAKNAERRKQNTKRKKAGESPLPMLPTPMECCLPVVKVMLSPATFSRRASWRRVRFWEAPRPSRPSEAGD